jgi:hypothetical protein
VKIKGIKGYLNITKVGTVRWRIQNDEGKSHRFDIPGTYLVPDLPIWLLSPQHLAKEMTRVDKEPDWTACNTYSDRVILSWQHGKYKRTVRLGKISVHLFRTSETRNSKKSEITVAYTANIPQTIIDEATTMATMKFNTGTNPIHCYSDTYEGTKPEDELMIRRMRLEHGFK